MCEDPVKCNYPDKYSGYEGAIRCLVENGGDVAFTKVIYVRRFFGVSGIFLSKYINTLTKLFLFNLTSEESFIFKRKKQKIDDISKINHFNSNFNEIQSINQHFITNPFSSQSTTSHRKRSHKQTQMITSICVKTALDDQFLTNNNRVHGLNDLGKVLWEIQMSKLV